MGMMTVSEYAAHRGCSARAVTKAIQAGRIDATRDGRAWSIDPDAADRQWQERTDPGIGGSHSHADDAAEPAAPSTEPDDGDGIETLAESRKRWSHHRARLAETEADMGAIKLRLERGELVSADDERKDAFRIARAFRDRMMNIPDRVASTLAAEGDAGMVHIILTREIRDACLELSKLDFDAPAAVGE